MYIDRKNTLLNIGITLSRVNSIMAFMFKRINELFHGRCVRYLIRKQIQKIHMEPILWLKVSW